MKDPHLLNHERRLDSVVGVWKDATRYLFLLLVVDKFSKSGKLKLIRLTMLQRNI